MSASTVIRFSDRRSAYGFVSELRRLYELDRFVDAQVQPVDGEVFVELPVGDWPAGLSDLVARHRGRAARPGELDGFREAIAQARETRRRSSVAMNRPREAGPSAAEALERANEWRSDGDDGSGPATAGPTSGETRRGDAPRTQQSDARKDAPETRANARFVVPPRHGEPRAIRRPAPPLPRPFARTRRSDVRRLGRVVRRRG